MYHMVTNDNYSYAIVWIGTGEIFFVTLVRPIHLGLTLSRKGNELTTRLAVHCTYAQMLKLGHSSYCGFIPEI